MYCPESGLNSNPARAHTDEFCAEILRPACRVERKEEALGKSHEKIGDELKQFIEAQKMFFVATAPAGSEGHINISPKGHDSLRILGPSRLAYLDLYGSGI